MGSLDCDLSLYMFRFADQIEQEFNGIAKIRFRHAIEKKQLAG